MPANTARLIRSKIERYASDPRNLANNVKALKGMDGYLRPRVNDWRVVFSETGEIIAIIRLPREAAYTTRSPT